MTWSFKSREVITKQDVESKGSGSTRPIHLLGSHDATPAPTCPRLAADAVLADGGGLLHCCPNGCYHRSVLSIQTVQPPCCPQAVMDNRNNAIPSTRSAPRHHRHASSWSCHGCCSAVQLASELWAGNMGENPYSPGEAEPVSGNNQAVPVTKPEASSNGSAPTVGLRS